jgi:hypothetical protein
LVVTLWDFYNSIFLNFFYRARPLVLHPSAKLEDHMSVFMSPSDRVAQLYPRHWVLFLSSSTTRRAVIEVLEPVSTWSTLGCRSQYCVS